jgi:hypothetical protein
MLQLPLSIGNNIGPLVRVALIYEEVACLASGIEALAEMMENDARTACGPRHARGKNRTAHRWGKTKGKIGFHGARWRFVSIPSAGKASSIALSSERCGIISDYNSTSFPATNMGILGGNDTGFLAAPDPSLAGRELIISLFAFARCV